MDELLKWLRDHLAEVIAALTAKLAQDMRASGTWHAEMRKSIVQHIIAAYMAGKGSETLGEKDIEALKPSITFQLDHLQKFMLKIQSETEFNAFWNLRAASYADGIKVPYWRGKTKLLPLPAMPAEGTQCLQNCKCKWWVEPLDVEAGDYDAYWERHADDSCQTCKQRAIDWNPVRIRGGELQL